jgi:hypothetical protein
VGNALVVALDGDRSGEAGDGDGAVDLRERVAHGLMDPMAGVEEGCGSGDEGERGENDKRAEEDAAAKGLQGSERASCGRAGSVRRVVTEGGRSEQNRVVWRGLGVHVQSRV